MARKAQVTFRIDPALLKRLDRLVSKRYFYNRSHALEVALSLLLDSVKVAKGPIIGIDEETWRRIMGDNSEEMQKTNRRVKGVKKV